MCASNVWSCVCVCVCVCVSAVSDEDPKPDEDLKLDEAPTPSLHELGEAIAGTGRLKIRWGLEASHACA